MDGYLFVGLFKLILINIVLSGDNAIVIALACRNLPSNQQKKAIFWGSIGAIGLRIVLTFIAVWLLEIPFVQIAGGLLLIYIAIKLLKNDGKEEQIQSSSKMGQAIKTIIIADLIMSLDNVLAMAGAARGNFLLIGLGLTISIPLIVWGSQLLMRLMNRFPIIVLLGAGLLGYTAGEMVLNDKTVEKFIESIFQAGHDMIPIGLAILVMFVGKIVSKKKVYLDQAVSEEVKSAV
ncbi:TerC family protein [Paenibacillus alginolyticus]|uniref:TerC family protein n=1 Tax=Paenibacillus alginolyticus TaxID=59839 RepID=UPI00040F0DD7|nr:TerC family protein [Paenibacillus alginolyticus]MCY9667818.1 TerC family protein [Paenibacillus alginolyticus]